MDCISAGNTKCISEGNTKSVFNQVYLSHDAKTHIKGKDNKTLCGILIVHNSDTDIKETWFCTRCLVNI